MIYDRVISNEKLLFFNVIKLAQVYYLSRSKSCKYWKLCRSSFTDRGVSKTIFF